MALAGGARVWVVPLASLIHRSAWKGYSPKFTRFADAATFRRRPTKIYRRVAYAAMFPTMPPLPGSSSTKKPSGSIGNTTAHSLPALYLCTISKAPSMLSACTATLKLVAPLFTSMEIFIILFFFRIDP